MIKKIITIFILTTSLVKANITPTDVFNEAKSIKLFIASMVNKNLGASLLPVVDIDLRNARPSNVYAMGVALNEKIRLKMRLKGINGWISKSYPNEKIKPKHVKDLMLIIERNLKKLEPSLNIKKGNASNKKPADVMQELIFANLWMDKFLTTKAKPNYPYQVIEKIEYELKVMMRELNISSMESSFQKYNKVLPKDVFINAQSIYLTLTTFDRVKFGDDNPINPYDILSSGIDIKPIDVFTMSTYILNYLYSLKYKLGFEINSNYSPKLKSNIKPNDVYQLYNNVHFLIIQIFAHLGVKK